MEIAAILLGVLMLVLCTPITLKVSYQDKVTVVVHYLFFRFAINQSEEKKEKKRHTPKKKKKAEKKPAQEKQEKSKKSVREILSMVQMILGSAKKPCIFFLHHLHIRKLCLRVIVCKEDAHETAVEYGRVNVYVYSALTLLRNYLDIQVKQIDIKTDFQGKAQSICASVELRALPLTLLITAGWFVYHFAAWGSKKNKSMRIERNDTMSEHISGLTDHSMKNLKDLVDADSIIGEPITTPDGTTIIPVSKVSFGFASGGSDLPTNGPKDVFGGGSGGGVTIQPLAFLVISNGDVRLLHINNGSTMGDHIVNMVPEMFDKISGIMKKDKDISQDKPVEVPSDWMESEK